MQTIIHINTVDERVEVLSVTEKGKVELTTYGDDTLTLAVNGKRYSANVLLEAMEQIIQVAEKINTKHETNDSERGTSTSTGQQQ
jgi:hypothetical protein